MLVQKQFLVIVVLVHNLHHIIKQQKHQRQKGSREA